jgi:Domain of unknown function (DUF4912)
MRPFADEQADPDADAPAGDVRRQDAHDGDTRRGESDVSRDSRHGLRDDGDVPRGEGDGPRGESDRPGDESVGLRDESDTTRDESDGPGGDAVAAFEQPPHPFAQDQARLLVQSPHRLYFYWSFAADPRAALRRALGGLAARYSAAVRLVDESAGEAHEAAPAAGDNFWFDALPGRSYRAEVGFAGEGLPFVRVLSSATVETPPVGVSAASDPAPEFGVGEREFARLLEATGFTPEPRQDAHGPSHGVGPTADAAASPASRNELTNRPARSAATSPQTESGGTSPPTRVGASSPSSPGRPSGSSSRGRASSPSSPPSHAEAGPREF